MKYTEPKKFFKIEILPIDAADLLEDIHVQDGIRQIIYKAGDKVLFDKSGNFSFMEDWIFKKHYKEMVVNLPEEQKIIEEKLSVMGEVI